ncbi:MAG: conjugal transfer protein TrbJ [Fusobacterium varium]|uniref:conjugal transfer protein TrbJ n=1 Tax=Fusobacterium varium TaxID=856 RepID=UPI00242BBCE5|nr:conjugal transfer protein TrbJ [Fusobacterium varium]MCI6033663.1 conjugal transfer protein TrbJ [Fusobacterium varium]MDY4004992.1 conjugal transfer protein TrbJ [Fusobacterium varium]
MKRKICLIGVFILLSISSFALFGGGGSSGIGKLVSIVERMETNQIAMKLDQLKQLEADLRNMANLGTELTTGQLQQLQNGLKFVMDTQYAVQSQINDYKNFQNQFKNVYNDFVDFKNLSPDDYILQADRLLNNTKNIMQDGMKMVGLANPEKIGNDAQRVRAIMSAANNAEGQQQVLQATATMAGHQIEVLSELKVLMAHSLKVQSAAIMEEVQKEALYKAQEDSLSNPKYELKQIRKSANVDRW